MVHKTGATWVKFGEVIFPLFVAQVHHAVLRENHTITSVARRHNTIEHIHSTLNAFKDIPRRTHTHEVARFVLWQNVIYHFNHGIHFFGRFAYCQSANGVSIAVKVAQAFSGILAQVGIYTTLHNREQVLLVSIEVGGSIKALDTTVEPTMGTFHGFLGICAVSGARATFIKCHHDVSTYLALDIHHVLGGEHQFTTINMGRELHAFFGHFANIGEGEYLKTARIGQYGACPSLKTMQSARFVQDVGTWSQIEVIGVT